MNAGRTGINPTAKTRHTALMILRPTPVTASGNNPSAFTHYYTNIFTFTQLFYLYD
jgi:hypothetical protein